MHTILRDTVFTVIAWSVFYSVFTGSKTIESNQRLTLKLISKPCRDSDRVQDLENKLQKVDRNLEETNICFCIYENTSITMVNDTSLIELMPKRLAHMNEVENDSQMLAALGQSPLRNYDPDEAEFFIVPTPMTKILLSRSEDYNTPINRLVYHKEYFRKHQGNKHVVISGDLPLFRIQQKEILK